MSIHSTKENLRVLYEDNHIIAINKRAGDLVQGDDTGDASLRDILMEYLKIKYNKPGNVFVGVSHRLDRPTSGVVVFAKTSKVLPRMNKLFLENKIHKTYLAVVDQKPRKEKDQLIHFLQRNTKQNKSYAFLKEVKDSKIAILDYMLLIQRPPYYLLEINLETGRHHQIRSQLSFLGCPIIGDMKYGFKSPNDDGSIHLHARNLSFIHPVSKKEINITAPVPDDFIWKKFSNDLHI